MARTDKTVKMSRVVPKIDPKARDVLMLLGAGAFLAASVVMPGLPLVLKPILEDNRRKRKEKWEKFNLWRLRQVLRRLEKQKVVEVSGSQVKLTEKGEQRLLKFNIEKMKLKERTDGKWRIIVYDIANLKKEQREMFRAILKKLKFLRLQKSVYLTPYVCDSEIEYLRELFNIRREVLVLKVSTFEHEKAYKKYFGI